MWVNFYLVPIVIRVCLVVLFPFSALDKIVYWRDALKQADSSFLPRALGPASLIVGIVIELAAPVLIVIGWHDRIAAFEVIDKILDRHPCAGKARRAAHDFGIDFDD